MNHESSTISHHKETCISQHDDLGRGQLGLARIPMTCEVSPCSFTSGNGPLTRLLCEKGGGAMDPGGSCVATVERFSPPVPSGS